MPRETLAYSYILEARPGDRLFLTKGNTWWNPWSGARVVISCTKTSVDVRPYNIFDWLVDIILDTAGMLEDLFVRRK